MSKKYLYYHIPKCGGTSVYMNMEQSLVRSRYLDLAHAINPFSVTEISNAKLNIVKLLQNNPYSFVHDPFPVVDSSLEGYTKIMSYRNPADRFYLQSI